MAFYIKAMIVRIVSILRIIKDRRFISLGVSTVEDLIRKKAGLVVFQDFRHNKRWDIELQAFVVHSSIKEGRYHCPIRFFNKSKITCMLRGNIGKPITDNLFKRSILNEHFRSA